MPSANDFVTSALRKLGVLEASETPSSADMELGFDALNDMVDAWALEPLMIHALLRTTKTLAASTASYTIGTGGSINIVRPVRIENGDALLIQDTTATYPIEIPFHVFTDQEWRHLSQKTATGTAPTGMYYDHKEASGLGTIYVYPIPTVGTTQLVLYTPLAITEFAAQSTNYTFAPGYRRAIIHNLAIELSADFAVPADIHDKVERIAIASKAAIKRRNYRPTELSMDPAFIGHGGAYNIESDQ
jgi:hypothetical protein